MTANTGLDRDIMGNRPILIIRRSSVLRPPKSRSYAGLVRGQRRVLVRRVLRRIGQPMSRSDAGLVRGQRRVLVRRVLRRIGQPMSRSHAGLVRGQRWVLVRRMLRRIGPVRSGASTAAAWTSGDRGVIAIAARVTAAPAMSRLRTDSTGRWRWMGAVVSGWGVLFI